MRIEQAEAIEQELWTNDVDVEIREDYSGRGMYGSTTVAIVIDRDDEQTAYKAMGRLDAEGVEGMTDHFRTDTLGRSRTLIY